MLSELLKAAAPYGLSSVLLVLVAYLYHLKDKALETEKTARIDDAKAFNKLAMDLQKEVILAVNKLSELVEIWEKREAEREREERIRTGRRQL